MYGVNLKHIVGGYRPSKSEQLIDIPQFRSSNTLTILSVANNASSYIIPDTVPIFDQGQLNSCTANSSCAAFEILLNISSNVIPLSRLFLYWNARVPIKETNVDDGCAIHDALNSLTTLGICEESEWMYDENNVNVQPSIICYKQGNDNQINSFYQITDSGSARSDACELAIRANHPVIFGTQVSNEYTSFSGKNTVWDIPNINSISGGHAQLLEGVRIVNNQRQFLVRNSWGSNWCDGGRTWFTEAYIEWDQTGDLFVPTLMPDLLV